MLTADARIETPNASRYLDQLCKHAAAIGAGRHGPRMHLGHELARSEVHVHVDRNDAHATLSFDPWGQCSMTADRATLTVRIEAADEQNLHRIRDTLARDLERFGGRERLKVTWNRQDQHAHDRANPRSAST